MHRVMKSVSILGAMALLTAHAHADMVLWQTQAAGTSGNVTASTNGGSGWYLDGTAGVAYDYGSLDGLDSKPVDGSTVEYIFNLTDSGTSIALGALYSWSPGSETLVFKLEQ